VRDMVLLSERSVGPENLEFTSYKVRSVVYCKNACQRWEYQAKASDSLNILEKEWIN
jgi:hypothetical protein